MMKWHCFLLLLSISAVNAQSQMDSYYQKKEFLRNGDTLRYRIMYPVNYDDHKKYPVVLFLHGKGERGRDNNKQLMHGATLFSDSAVRSKFQSIVIFPQCTPDDYWCRMNMIEDRTDSTPERVEYLTDVPPGKSLHLVMQLLDSLSESKQVDHRRMYVMGLSMGGRGTYELLWRKPHFFAAAVPVCGGGNPSSAALYGKKFPIWIFHGDNDNVVNVNDSRNMVTALKAAGAKVKYTEYRGAGHNVWDYALADPNLLPWLFAQKRK